MRIGSDLTWSRPLTYLGHDARGPLVLDGEPLLVSTVTQAQVKALLATLPDSEPGSDRHLPEHTVVPPDMGLGDLAPERHHPLLSAWL